MFEFIGYQTIRVRLRFGSVSDSSDDSSRMKAGAAPDIPPRFKDDDGDDDDDDSMPDSVVVGWLSRADVTGAGTELPAGENSPAKNAFSEAGVGVDYVTVVVAVVGLIIVVECVAAYYLLRLRFPTIRRPRTSTSPDSGEQRREERV